MFYAVADGIGLVHPVEREAFVPPRSPSIGKRPDDIALPRANARSRSADHQVERRMLVPVLGSAGLEERVHLGDDQADPDVVCIGYPTGLLWVEDLAEVNQYNALFRRLQALSPEDSAAF